MFYDKAFGYTIFCDDIRMEADGKVSFIGSYHMGTLVIHVPFPATLAKFAMGINYMEEREAFSHDIKVKIFMPDQEEESDEAAFEFQIERSLIQSAEISEGKFFRFFTPVIVAPLQLMRPGKIKVRAHCGDVVIKMGVLTVSEGQSPLQAGNVITPSVPETDAN
jgi:hypothetical protein